MNKGHCGRQNFPYSHDRNAIMSAALKRIRSQHANSGACAGAGGAGGANQGTVERIVAIAEVVDEIQVHITEVVEKSKRNCARKKDHVRSQGMEIMRNLSVHISMPSASKL